MQNVVAKRERLVDCHIPNTWHFTEKEVGLPVVSNGSPIGFVCDIDRRNIVCKIWSDYVFEFKDEKAVSLSVACPARTIPAALILKGKENESHNQESGRMYAPLYLR